MGLDAVDQHVPALLPHQPQLLPQLLDWHALQCTRQVPQVSIFWASFWATFWARFLG
jgi:hypothetical protein